MNRLIATCTALAVSAPIVLTGCGDGASTDATTAASTAPVTRDAMSQSKGLWVTNNLPVDIALAVPSTGGDWILTPSPLAPTPKGLVGTVAAGATISPSLTYNGKGYTTRKSTAAPSAEFTLSVTPQGGEASAAIPFSVFGKWTSKRRNKKTWYATNDIGWAPAGGGFQTACTSRAPEPITYTGVDGTKATGTIAVTCGGGGQNTRVTVAPG